METLFLNIWTVNGELGLKISDQKNEKSHTGLKNVSRIIWMGLRINGIYFIISFETFKNRVNAENVLFFSYNNNLIGWYPF
jgi:hypothetical protein